MLEKEIIKDQKLDLLFYKRYIDDTFIIYDKKHTTGEEILEKFNVLDRNIKFTMEKPSEEGFLPFLDMEFKINKHNLITHRWFQKPIHSLNLLHKKSATLDSTKMNVVVNMIMTAILNSNTMENINYSITKIKKLFRKERI